MGFAAKMRIALLTLISVAAAFGLDQCGGRLEARALRTGSGRPARLALFTPAIVEIAYALGAGDRVVGVTRFASFPPAVKRLPTLGGQEDIDYERMTALDPDLIATQNAGEQLVRYARTRGIALVDLEIENTRDVLSACIEMGRVLGLADEGVRLAGRIEESLEAVRSAVAGRRRKTVFLSVDRTPGPLKGLLSAGRDSFLTELVEIAGGRNLMDDTSSRYPVVSKETLLVRAPEVLLELRPRPLAPKQRELLARDWQALRSIEAVSRGQVHVISHEQVLIPGPRIGEVARLIAARLHPEVALRGAGEENHRVE